MLDGVKGASAEPPVPPIAVEEANVESWPTSPASGPAPAVAPTPPLPTRIGTGPVSELARTLMTVTCPPPPPPPPKNLSFPVFGFVLSEGTKSGRSYPPRGASAAAADQQDVEDGRPVRNSPGVARLIATS